MTFQAAGSNPVARSIFFSLTRAQGESTNAGPSQEGFQ